MSIYRASFYIQCKRSKLEDKNFYTLDISTNKLLPAKPLDVTNHWVLYLQYYRVYIAPDLEHLNMFVVTLI